MSQKNKGIYCILLSSFFFALMNLFVRLSGDLPSIQKSFFRNFVAMLFAAAILWKERPEIKLDRTSKKYLLYRSVCGTVGILCNFYAVDHLVLADASMLNKMSPFFAVIFGILILKERVSLFQGGCVVAAFTGVLFVVKPTGLHMDLFPALIGLLGGLGAGIAYTYVRALGQRGVKGPFIVFFFSAFSCVSAFLCCHAAISAVPVHFHDAGTAGNTAPCRACGGGRTVYDYNGLLLRACKGDFRLRLFADTLFRASGISHF